ncbi:MAG TPA: hypothetical protein VL026_00930 [Rhizomicrobium sp.]|nr:hypothetical protein [Rhizomicrobium sp.]
MILNYVLVALSAIAEILKAGGNAMVLVGQIQSTIGVLQAEKRDPSSAEWEALNAQIAAAMAALN